MIGHGFGPKGIYFKDGRLDRVSFGVDGLINNADCQYSEADGSKKG